MPTLSLDPYIVDTLLPDLVGHDRSASAFLVYLFLWRRTAGAGARTAALSLREIAEGTGLSKRAVQTALRSLAGRRRLIGIARAHATAIPEYTVLRPWAARRARNES